MHRRSGPPFPLRVSRWLCRRLSQLARIPTIWLREQILNASIDEGMGRFIIVNRQLKVTVSKHAGAHLTLHGNVIIRSDLGGENPIRIRIGKNGILVIKGDFIVGDGTLLSVGSDASLYIGGQKNDSGSGITCDSKILVQNRVEIGFDVICAWNVLITDSDHHQIIGQSARRPVTIGDHVWIASGATILKGSNIGADSIVAASSVVRGQTYPARSLIAGIPARVVKSAIAWKRDIAPVSK